jgi:hypothetical protein
MEELQKLYDALSREGYYTKSFEDFQEQYADPAYRDKVFGVVTRDGLYTKSREEFDAKYTTVKKKDDSGASPLQPQAPSGESESFGDKAKEFFLDRSPLTSGVVDVYQNWGNIKKGWQSFAEAWKSEDAKTADKVMALSEAVEEMGWMGEALSHPIRGAADGMTQIRVTGQVGDVFRDMEAVSDKDAMEYIEALRNAEQHQQKHGASEAMKEFNAEVEKHGNEYIGAIVAMAKNPGVGVEVMASSLVGMFNKESFKAFGAGFGAVEAGAGTVGLIGGPAGSLAAAGMAVPWALRVGMGAAGATMETMQYFSQALAEEAGGAENLTPDRLREMLSDEDAMKRVRNSAIARGATIGAIELVGGAAVSRVAKGSRTLAKTTEKAVATSTKATAKSLGVELAGETIVGSAGEVAGTLAAGDELSGVEVILEGFAGTPGGLANTAITSAFVKKPTYKLNGQEVTKEALEDVVSTSTYDQLKKMRIEIDEDEAFGETLIENIESKKDQPSFGEVAPGVAEELIDEAKGTVTETQAPDQEEEGPTLSKQVSQAMSDLDSQIEEAQAELDEAAERAGVDVESPAQQEAATQKINNLKERKKEALRLIGEAGRAQEETADAEVTAATEAAEFGELEDSARKQAELEAELRDILGIGSEPEAVTVQDGQGKEAEVTIENDTQQETTEETQEEQLVDDFEEFDLNDDVGGKLLESDNVDTTLAEEVRTLQGSLKGKAMQRGKVVFHKTQESMRNIDENTRQETAEIFGYMDENGTLHFGPSATRDTVREEFAHKAFVAAIGENSATRGATFDSLIKLARKNKRAEEILRSRVGTYSEVDVSGMSIEEISELVRREDIDTAEVEEEAIMGLMIDYAKDPSKYKSQKNWFIKAAKTILDTMGLGGTIKNENDVIALGKKLERATKGKQVDVDAVGTSRKGRMAKSDFPKGGKIKYKSHEYAVRIGYSQGEYGSPRVAGPFSDYDHFANWYRRMVGQTRDGQYIHPQRIGEMRIDIDGVEYMMPPPKPVQGREFKRYDTYAEAQKRKAFDLAEQVKQADRKRAEISNEASSLWKDGQSHLSTNFFDFFPEGVQEILDGLPVVKKGERFKLQVAQAKIEAAEIQLENIRLFNELEITEEEMQDLKGRGSRISTAKYPELFNLSGIEHSLVREAKTVQENAEGDYDGAYNNIADAGETLNPGPEEKPKKGRFSKASNATRASNKKKEGDVYVKSYTAAKPKTTPWRAWAQKERAAIFNVAWDQVMGGQIVFEGNPQPYDLNSGVLEVQESIVRKEDGSIDPMKSRGPSFRTEGMQVQFLKKAREVYENLKDGESGIMGITISMNGAENILGNPLLFEAYLDNMIKAVEDGRVSEADFLNAFNTAFNISGNKVDSKSPLRRLGEAKDAPAVRTRFKGFLDSGKVKKTPTENPAKPIYEVQDFEAAKQIVKDVLVTGTLRSFTDTGASLARSSVAKNTKGIPTFTELKDKTILPDYLTDNRRTGKPQRPSPGTVVAVMEVDLRVMFRGEDPSFRSDVRESFDEKSSFPYQVMGLTDLRLLSRPVEASEALVVRKPSGDTVKATGNELGRGVNRMEVKVVSSRKGRMSKGNPVTPVTHNGKSFEVRQKSRVQEVIDNFLRRWANKYRDIELLQADVETARGSIVEESQDFKMAEELMYGKAATALENLQERTDEIVAIMRENGISEQEITDYLYARHAIERNDLLLEKEGVDHGSGITNEEAQAILDEVATGGKQDIFDALEEKIQAIAQDTRDTMRKLGLETDARIDSFEAMYKHYVPLAGIAIDESGENTGTYPSGGVGFHVSGSRIKAAKGRKTPAQNLLAQIVHMNAAVHVRGQKNEVMKALYSLIKENPNSEVWKVFNPENKNETRGLGDPDVVGVRIDGKQMAIQFADPSHAQTLRGMGVQKTNLFLKTMRALSGWLRRSYTTLRPEFAINNFARDIGSAVFNAAAETEIEGGMLNGQKVVKDMMAMVPSSLKAFLKDSVGKDSDPLIKKYFNEFKEDGGRTGWGYIKSIQQIQEEILSETEDQKGGLRGAAKKLFGKIEDTAEFVEGVNEAFENSIRMAAYVAARKNGISRAKAAQFAKNVTVNFNKQGEYGQAMNAIYLFFNAGVQGTARFARSMFLLKPKQKADGTMRKGRERITTPQKLAGSMVLFNAMLTMLNIALSDKDEDDELFYNKIPDYVKERAMIIMVDGENYIKIPMPYGYNIFANMGQTMAEVGAGERDPWSGVTFMANSALTSFSPMSFGQSKDLITSLSKGAVPTPFKPIVDILANETYFGGKVHAEQSPFGAPKPESEMSFRSPEGVKSFFRFMNEATGGSEDVPGKLDFNPDNLYYLFEYAIGGVGRDVTRGIETGRKLAAKSEDSSIDVEFNDIAMMRALYGEPSKYYDFETYADRRDEIVQLSREYKKATAKEVRANKQRYKGLTRLEGEMKYAERKLKKIRAERREARNIKDYTKRTSELQRLFEEERKVIMEFNRIYNNVKG